VTNAVSARDLIQLTKLPITSAVASTTTVGFVMSSGTIDLRLPPLLAGVLLLACGSAALNHVQEPLLDGRMQRTRGRPIPAGRVRSGAALSIAVVLSTAGAGILWLWSPPPALFLALFTLVWYNAVYTYLKRLTAFAVIPGALVGALPPLIGWAAAGGDPFSQTALVLALFFFIWQIPHFWLLLLMHGSEYEQAGLPALTALYPARRLARVTFAWLVCATLTGMLFPLYGLLQQRFAVALLLLISCALLWQARALLAEQADRSSYRAAFGSTNLYGLLVMALLAGDRLLT